MILSINICLQQFLSWINFCYNHLRIISFYLYLIILYYKYYRIHYLHMVHHINQYNHKHKHLLKWMNILYHMIIHMYNLNNIWMKYLKLRCIMKHIVFFLIILLYFKCLYMLALFSMIRWYSFDLFNHKRVL